MKTRRNLRSTSALLLATLVIAPAASWAWDPKVVAYDPLVHMPGTQPAAPLSFEAPSQCLGCHAGYAPSIEPGFLWKGTMMGQAARDPFFWAALTVAAQDSVFALGNPNGTDICLRCHAPKGWLELRSDPTSGAALEGADFDGVQCDFCHRMIDPFFQDTYDGTREGADWSGYWDEFTAGGMVSQVAADKTYQADILQSSMHSLFNGNPFYGADHRPISPGYRENTSGQFYMSDKSDRRGPFADATAFHPMLYSRYHKSKYYCSTCHDVSNPALANMALKDTMPGDGSTILPTESTTASEFFHVERTFSEFMLSDYGKDGGSPGVGPYDPAVFKTSKPGNAIATCQDCHMPDGVGTGCSIVGTPVRPTDSVEHAASGQPLHDLTGGNALVPYLLASTVPWSSNYDEVNAMLLGQGAAAITMTLDEGTKLDPEALIAASNRAKWSLGRAASIQNLSYDPQTGSATLRLRNNTGHKLISGYPEGRRMFLNVRLYNGDTLLHETNPYDDQVGTLRGLDPAYSPDSPPLAANEVHNDSLVFEVVMSSSLTGEAHSMHFLLGTERYKDNRIPPKGFRIAEAGKRITEPVIGGTVSPNYFTAAEYAGGYDDISLSLPQGASRIEVRLYYQTTSREYAAFLRDEILGTGTSLKSPTPSGEPSAYIVQTDPFFLQLRAWGDTIWQLWEHNKDVPGAKPIEMTKASLVVRDICADPGAMDGMPCDDQNACTVGEACMGGACTGGNAADCSDNNPCTDDSCDMTLGCTHKPNTDPCDDNNPCTLSDSCAFGVCTGKPKPCIDGDSCTTDSCDPAAGCVYTPIPNCGSGGSGGTGGSGGMGGSGGSAGAGGMGGAGGSGGNGGASSSSSSSGELPPIENGDCNCIVAGGSAPSSNGALSLLGVVFGLGLRARRRSRRDRRTGA